MAILYAKDILVDLISKAVPVAVNTGLEKLQSTIEKKSQSNNFCKWLNDTVSFGTTPDQIAEQTKQMIESDFFVHCCLSDEGKERLHGLGFIHPISNSGTGTDSTTYTVGGDIVENSNIQNKVEEER